MSGNLTLDEKLDALASQLAAIVSRVEALENRPNETEALSAVNTDLDDLKNRLSIVEQAPSGSDRDPALLSPRESMITRSVIGDYFSNYLSRTDEQLPYHTPLT